MNTHEERAPDYVEHIIGAIGRIKTYVGGMGEPEFLPNVLVQDGVVRQLLVIGEASNRRMRQCPAFTRAHPEVAWRSAYDTRNVIAHGYTDINLEAVWSIVVEDLPGFRTRMQALLDSVQK